ncbi:MAG: DUF6506 family protein [Eubacteriales bacterium]
MKKKFAFLLMGAHYRPVEHQVKFETEHQITCIYTVQNFEQAVEMLLDLDKQGFGAIELCGAFGQEKAKEFAEMTGNRIAIGYVVHAPEMDEAFTHFFG